MALGLNGSVMRKSVLMSVFIAGCAATPLRVVPAGTWTEQCYINFEQDVSQIAGESAVDCGFLAMQATDAERNLAKSCAKSAVKAGNPFKFGYQGFGVDSVYCDVAVRRVDGQMVSVYFDSDVTGQMGSGGNNSALWASRCKTIKFKPGTIGVGSFFDLQNCTEAPDIISNLASQKMRPN